MSFLVLRQRWNPPEKQEYQFIKTLIYRVVELVACQSFAFTVIRWLK